MQGNASSLDPTRGKLLMGSLGHLDADWAFDDTKELLNFFGCTNGTVGVVKSPCTSGMYTGTFIEGTCLLQA